MQGRIWTNVLALALVALFCASFAARADESFASKPFKLTGSGGVDLQTLNLGFSGTATHLGLYAAEGSIDLTTLAVQGTLTSADGDSLLWIAQFIPGPTGEIDITLVFLGGTGSFAGASGAASGPVSLAPDFTFSLEIQGEIVY